MDLINHFFIVCRYIACAVVFVSFMVMIYKGVLNITFAGMDEFSWVKINVIGWCLVSTESLLEVLFFPTSPGPRVLFLLLQAIFTLWVSLYKVPLRYKKDTDG